MNFDSSEISPLETSLPEASCWDQQSWPSGAEQPGHCPLKDTGFPLSDLGTGRGPVHVVTAMLLSLSSWQPHSHYWAQHPESPLSLPNMISVPPPTSLIAVCLPKMWNAETLPTRLALPFCAIHFIADIGVSQSNTEMYLFYLVIWENNSR